jgi:hypothetical protein
MVWMMNDPPKHLEPYVTGQICSKTLRGMILATQPSFSHICMIAPISPVVSILHNLALLCPTRPCICFFMFSRR